MDCSSKLANGKAGGRENLGQTIFKKFGYIIGQSGWGDLMDIDIQVFGATDAPKGHDHGGIIFVDHKTIPSSDFGGLIRALQKTISGHRPTRLDKPGLLLAALTAYEGWRLPLTLTG